MDALQTLAEAMAGMGITITEKTKLTFGTKVAKTLASVNTGGKVFVWTAGATDAQLLTEASITEAATEAGNDLSGFLGTVDATSAEYGKVRPHVNTFLNTRKVAFGISTPVKNEDGVNVGFVITKR